MHDLKDLLKEDGLDKWSEFEEYFDHEEATITAVATFKMCVYQKDVKGVIQHTGSITALGVELEDVKLTQEELNWVVGVLMKSYV